MAMKTPACLCLAFLLGTLSSPASADDSYLSQYAGMDTCARGNFLKEYALDLQRLGLPPLSPAPGTEHYRFEIVAPFTKAILIDLRVLKDGGAEAIAYEVPWDSEPHLIPKPIKRSLSKGWLRRFRALLEQGEFWRRYPFGWGHGLDTSEWIFEGIRGEDYHVFSTSDPAPKYLHQAGSLLFRSVMDRDIPR
jgi:hypothetical protein